ncbi:MAG: hypothetical protein AABX23_01315 [Nanoarchaeota archaeon]
MITFSHSLEDLKEITRQSLRDKFPLFEESHKVDASRLSSNNLWIGYRTKWGSAIEVMENTHFDLNITAGIFYGVSLFLDQIQRGNGLGWRLYETTHEVAKKLGFEFIRRSPSGGFHRSGKLIESRRDYLLRRGYIPAGENQLDFRLIT